MANTDINQIIKDRFNKLPPKLQEAITSTEVALKLREISQKYRLHIDQGQILENETYMVLLGIEQSENYKENLKKELRISEENAIKISNDVAKEIFLSVRNILKETTTIPPKKDTKNINITPIGVKPDDKIIPTKKTPISYLNEDSTITHKPKTGDSSQGIVSGDRSSSQGIVSDDSQGIKPIDQGIDKDQPSTDIKTPETEITPTSTTITSVYGTETENTSKLDSVVRNKPKVINVVATKGYTVDPYREPIK